MYGNARWLLCWGGAGERSLGACGAGICREAALAGRSLFRHAEACRGGGIGGAGRRDPARDKPVSRRPQKSAILLSVAARAEDTAGCPSGQRERSVKPSAQPTQVRTLHLPHQQEEARHQRKRGDGPLALCPAVHGCHRRSTVDRSHRFPSDHGGAPLRLDVSAATPAPAVSTSTPQRGRSPSTRDTEDGVVRSNVSTTVES